MADPDKPPPVGTALPGVLSDDDNTGAKRLSRVGVFRELSPRTVERIAQLVEERSVEAGTEIVRSGGTERDLFMLERGTCAVRAGTDATVLARLGPGDVFGERALLTGEPRSATVVAETDASLLVLAAQPFDRLRREGQRALGIALEVGLPRAQLEGRRLAGSTVRLQAKHWKRAARVQLAAACRFVLGVLVGPHHHPV